MSTRRLFLTQLGLAVASLAVLPTPAEVEKVLSEKYQGDPFWHIRELMKRNEKPDWEYQFRLDKVSNELEKEQYAYTVMLLQNGNIHRETWYTLFGKKEFPKRHQTNVFCNLMQGVGNFNNLSKEKQQEIRDIMVNRRHYL